MTSESAPGSSHVAGHAPPADAEAVVEEAPPADAEAAVKEDDGHGACSACCDAAYGACSTCWNAMFPFGGPHHNRASFLGLWWMARSPEAIHAINGAVWLAAAYIFIYVFLTMSSRSSCEDEEDLHAKEPSWGSHLHYFVFAKQLVQFYLLHHLCGDLTVPPEGAHDPRFTHLEKRGSDGLLQWIRWLYYGLTCRRRLYRERWLSQHVADHILLIGAGLGYIFNQFSMLHIQLTDSATAVCLGDNVSGIVGIQAALNIYMAILVMGFICRVLERGIEPRRGSSIHFRALMLLFLLLWSTEFLVVLLERYVYTNGWKDVNYSLRIAAAIAQLFVTHSSIMLGAILLGHSAHFKRSPDVSWHMLLARILPVGALAMGVGLWVGYRRDSQVWPECMSFHFEAFARTWPYFFAGFRCLGGLLLLAATFAGRSAQELQMDREAAEAVNGDKGVLSLLDYDAALVVITLSFGVLWDVTETLYAFKYSSLQAFTHALGVLGPTGLALVTLNLWRRPKKLLRRRNRWLGWFALLFAISWLVIFEEKEDCEVSSSAPSCCDYPWLLDSDEKKEMCNFDERCRHGPSYCTLSHEPRALGSLSEDPAREYCDHARKERHNAWILSGEAKREFEDHEEKMPLALVLFRTIGTAASVEMYFTIIGVLMKVVILTGHSKSPEIIQLNAEQHSH